MLKLVKFYGIIIRPKRQNERLKKLKAMEQRKKNGKRVNTKPIVEGLQRAGILDKNGDLAHPYRDNE